MALRFYFFVFFFFYSHDSTAINRDCSTALSDCNAQYGGCNISSSGSSVYRNGGITYFRSCSTSDVICDTNEKFNPATNSCDPICSTYSDSNNVVLECLKPNQSACFSTLGFLTSDLLTCPPDEPSDCGTNYSTDGTSNTTTSCSNSGGSCSAGGIVLESPPACDGTTIDTPTCTNPDGCSGAGDGTGTGDGSGTGDGTGTGDITCGSVACETTLNLVLGDIRSLVTKFDASLGPSSAFSSVQGILQQKLPTTFTKFERWATIFEAVNEIIGLAKDVWRSQDVQFHTDVTTKLGDLESHLQDLSSAVSDPATGETLLSLAKQIKSNTDALESIKTNTDNLEGIKRGTDNLEAIKRGTDNLDGIKKDSGDILEKLGKLSVLDSIRDAILACCVGCDLQLDSNGNPSTKTCSDGSVVPATSPCPLPQASVQCVNGAPVVTCTGDPVNCAILRGQSVDDCIDLDPSQWTTDPPPPPPIDDDPGDPFSFDGKGNGSGYVGYLALLLPFLPDSLNDAVQSENVDVSNDLDTGGLGWSGSCPAPDTYSLGMVGELTIDYSPFCKLAEINSFLVIFVASMISLRILFSVT